MKRTVPLLIASLTGLVMIVAAFVPAMETWEEEVMTWFNILAAFAFILGGGNLLMTHLQAVSDQRAGWGYSAITLIAFVYTLVVGMLKVGVAPADNFPNHAWSGAVLQEGGALWWVFEYIINPIDSTFCASSSALSSNETNTPGSSYCCAPRTRNSIANIVFPHPALPQTSVVRPLGRPPPVISSRP